jgi:hypothetical protein
MIPPNRPPDKSGSVAVRPHPGDPIADMLPIDRETTDPRLDAFARWVRAADRNDVTEMRASTRTLRSLRISVVALTPPAGREGRT